MALNRVKCHCLVLKKRFFRVYSRYKSCSILSTPIPIHHPKLSYAIPQWRLGQDLKYSMDTPAIKTHKRLTTKVSAQLFKKFFGGRSVYPRLSYAITKGGRVRFFTVNWSLLHWRLTTRSFSSIGQKMAELLRIQRTCGGGGWWVPSKNLVTLTDLLS